MDKKITRGINCNCPKCGNNFNVYVPQLFKDDDRTSPLNFGEYVEERIKSAHLKWNKEMREKVVSIIGAVKLGIISKEKGYDHLLSELNTLEVKEEE